MMAEDATTAVEVEVGQAPRTPPPPQASRRSFGWKRLAVIALPLIVVGVVAYAFVSGGPSLPSYSASVNGEAATRVHLGGDGRFELVARPSAPPVEKIVAFAFVIIGGEPSPLEAKVQVGPDGGIKIEGGARSLRDAEEIRLVVGTPAAIGKFDDALLRAQHSNSDSHVRVLAFPVDRPR